MKRFYHSLPLKLNQNIYLDDASAHHALQVMRVKKKDQLILFNGDGYNYLGEAIEIEKKKLKIHILSREKNFSESPIKLILIQSLSTNEKMDWIIQKATELGVNQIYPINSSRSIIKLDKERSDKKLMHWRQIAISASEQSGRAIIPEIHSPISFPQAVNQIQLDNEALKIILAPNSVDSFDKANTHRASTIVLLIGPEGGFSDEEIRLAEQHQYFALKLGPRILRTETAPLCALSILQYKYGDLS